MLYSAVVLFVVGLLAAVCGFSGTSVVVVGLAQVLFVLFALLAIANFVSGFRRGADPVADR